MHRVRWILLAGALGVVFAAPPALARSAKVITVKNGKHRRHNTKATRSSSHSSHHRKSRHGRSRA